MGQLALCHPENRHKALGLCVLCYNRRFNGNRRRIRFEAQLQRYGLTLEQYQSLLNQGCALCHESFNETPHMDHDKKTGEFRGLLCTGHNLGIGLLGDTLDGVSRAVEYLSRKETQCQN